MTHIKLATVFALCVVTLGASLFSVSEAKECLEEHGYQQYLVGEYDSAYESLAPCANLPTSSGRTLYWLGHLIRFTRHGDKYTAERRNEVVWVLFTHSALRGYEHGINGLAGLVEQRASAESNPNLKSFSLCLRGAAKKDETDRKAAVYECVNANDLEKQ